MNDFAIVKIGNSQEVVSKGTEILVHKISGEPKTAMTFEEVLLRSTKDKVEIGTPFIKGAKIEAEIIEQTKGPKVEKETFKAKARQRKHVGHRQELTKIKILSI